MATRITLSIQGMECPNCAMKLETIEDRLAGVILAEASYRKGQLVVEYNEAVVNESQIRTVIENLGYQVSGKK
jgi:copper chaperone CopZ